MTDEPIIPEEPTGDIPVDGEGKEFLADLAVDQSAAGLPLPESPAVVADAVSASPIAGLEVLSDAEMTEVHQDPANIGQELHQTDEPTPVPVAEPAPAPIPAPTFDERGAAGEQKEPEKEPTPVYGGEYSPMYNVAEPNPVLTPEGPNTKKLDPLYLPNVTPDELAVIRRSFYTMLNEHQRSRHETARQGLDHDFVPQELADGKVIYMTEGERDTFVQIQLTDNLLRKGAGNGLLDDEEDQWTNLPERNKRMIGIRQLNYETSTDPVMRIRGKLGMATESPVPLWNSGMHMTIEGQGALDSLQLQTRMIIEKTESGRETSGYVFSASSIYQNRLLIDFILEHVVNTTAGKLPPQELSKLVKLTDLEPMVLGAAAVNYPDGYPLERPCLTNHGGCGHVVKRTVNLHRMLFVRNSRISNSQFDLMDKKAGPVDVKTIRDYQDSVRPEVSQYIEVEAGIYLKLRNPSIYDAVRISGAWMSRMDSRAKQLIPSNANEQQRELYLVRATSIAMVMSLGHWVEALVEREENGVDYKTVITRVYEGKDPDLQSKSDLEMDKFLEDISGDSEMADKITEGIEKFINEMSLTSVCVTKVVCPNCNHPVTGDNKSDHPHLVQVNPIELFFTLLHLKVQRAGG